MYDMPSLMYVIPSLIFVACHASKIYAYFLTCYTPNLMYLVSSFVCDVLKFLLKTLSCDVNFNTSCMIIGSGMFKFVHVASPVIYAILRLPLLLYRLFSFLAYQLPYVACKPNKFMLYQNLSTTPLFSVIPYSERLSSLAEA